MYMKVCGKMINIMDKALLQWVWYEIFLNWVDGKRCGDGIIRYPGDKYDGKWLIIKRMVGGQ